MWQRQTGCQIQLTDCQARQCWRSQGCSFCTYQYIDLQLWWGLYFLTNITVQDSFEDEQIACEQSVSKVVSVFRPALKQYTGAHACQLKHLLSAAAKKSAHHHISTGSYFNTSPSPINPVYTILFGFQMHKCSACAAKSHLYPFSRLRDTAHLSVSLQPAAVSHFCFCLLPQVHIRRKSGPNVQYRLHAGHLFGFVFFEDMCRNLNWCFGESPVDRSRFIQRKVTG